MTGRRALGSSAHRAHYSSVLDEIDAFELPTG